MSESKQPTDVAAEPSSSDSPDRIRAAVAWRKMFAKRWVFPAVYVAAAAMLVAFVWMFREGRSSPGVNPTPGDAPVVENVTGESPSGGGAVAVNAPAETFRSPARDPSAVQVVRPYFDPGASGEQKQAAVVKREDEFTLHVGVDYARPDAAPFEVVAVYSGKVTRVGDDPVVGKVVEITHPNGYVSVYQSLGEIAVAEGQDVRQGDPVGKSGENELERELGNHLHFELRKAETWEPVHPDKAPRS